MNKIAKLFLQTFKRTKIICPICTGECYDHKPYQNSCLVKCNDCNRCFCAIDNEILINWGERCIKCGAGETYLIKNNLNRGCYHCRINWVIFDKIKFINVQILEIKT